MPQRRVFVGFRDGALYDLQFDLVQTDQAKKGNLQSRFEPFIARIALHRAPEMTLSNAPPSRQGNDLVAGIGESLHKMFFLLCLATYVYSNLN